MAYRGRISIVSDSDSASPTDVPSSPIDVENFEDARMPQDVAMISEERIEALERAQIQHSEALGSIQQALDGLMRKLNTFDTDQVRATNAENVRLPPSPPPHVSTVKEHASKLKPSVPIDFDGDRTKGRAFINSCSLYFSIATDRFDTDQSKIHWALSYMKLDRAATFADRVLRHEAREGSPKFATWAEFHSTFIETFCPENASTEAIMKLESVKYFQGKRTVDAYIDEFVDLVDVAGYTDKVGIVVKFRRGLDGGIQDKIAESRNDRPADNDIAGWIKAARCLDANRVANEAFHASAQGPRRAPLPAGGILPRTFFTRPTTQPPPPPPHSKPAPRPLPPGIPMDVDSNKSRALPVTCFRCGKTGHVSRECPKRFDIRLMTTEEREDWIAGLLASADAVAPHITTDSANANTDTDDDCATETTVAQDFPSHNE